MKASTKEIIYLGAALLGAYSAWLHIREKQYSNQQFSNWFTSGSTFNQPGSFDFYGMDYSALDYKSPAEVMRDNPTTAAYRMG